MTDRGRFKLAVVFALPVLAVLGLSQAAAQSIRELDALRITDMAAPPEADANGAKAGNLRSLQSLGSLNDLGKRAGAAGTSDGATRRGPFYVFEGRRLHGDADHGASDLAGIAVDPSNPNTQIQPVTGRVTGIAVDPSDPSRQFNGFVSRFSQGDVDSRTRGSVAFDSRPGVGVLKSTDGGRTWAGSSAPATLKK